MLPPNDVRRAMTDRVAFFLNKPIQVALKYNGLGRECQGSQGQPRFLFTLTDDRVMFLDPPEARYIAEHFAAGELFWICKRSGGKGRAPIWQFWVGDRRTMEEQLEPNATPLARDLARSLDRANAARNPEELTQAFRATRSGHGELAVPAETTGAGRGASQPQPAPASHSNEPETVPASVAARKPAASFNGNVPKENGVILQACALVDAMAAVMNHAAQYGQVISREDVRSLVVTSFINLAGGGSARQRGAA